MELTRRDLLRGAGAFAGLRLLAPLGWTEALAAADPATRQRYRLVLIYLSGGNDGLNTVVPASGSLRTVYECVRTPTEIAASSLLPLDRGGDAAHGVGLNPNLKTIHSLYQQDRVAVVQGVDYPNHNYSHFTSRDIWESGVPDSRHETGWIGRHLDRVHALPTELRAVAVAGRLPLTLRGDTTQGMQVNGLPVKFADGTAAAYAAMHDAYGRFDRHPDADADRAYYGDICGTTLGLVTDTAPLTTAATTSAIVNAMLAARELLTANLGVETVYVERGGFDTHNDQSTAHPALLEDVDEAIEAFLFGTRGGLALTKTVTDPLTGLPVQQPIGPMDPEIASRTIVMTYSEFGRRLGDNGSGTDHGAAAPLFLVGPPKTGPYAPLPGSGAPVLTPGLHGEHPPLSSSSCTTAIYDNLGLTTDVRSVYNAMLVNWLRQPLDGANADPGDPELAVSGTNYDADGALVGLFGRA